MTLTVAPGAAAALATKRRRVVETAILVTGSAAFYAATMILMKSWGALPPVAMGLLIAAAFALAAWCEVEALRIERLSTVYVAILAVECVMVALVSFAILGETVTLREAAGGVLVLAGVMLAAT